jgi:octaprenyl-diphosphate synthase
MAAYWDAYIKEDLRSVDEEIRRSVQSRQPLLTEIAQHVIGYGGKRIRPGVALLSFHSVGGKDSEKVIKLAAAFELIHSATLVHDDINDGSILRRGRSSAFRKFGVQKALITGDFLFVQGFRLGGSLDAQEVVAIVADACVAMAESEILQNEVERVEGTDMPTYMEIIRGKTARSIEASARVGAYIGGGSGDQNDALGQYGLNIGMAFQVVDDILDLTGGQEVLGKPPGMDIQESKANLPLMIAMEDRYPCSARVREVFRKEGKTAAEVEEVIALVKGTDALEVARSHAEKFRDAALAALKSLPPSVYRNSLVALAETVLDRSS